MPITDKVHQVLWQRPRLCDTCTATAQYSMVSVLPGLADTSDRLPYTTTTYIGRTPYLRKPLARTRFKHQLARIYDGTAVENLSKL